MGLIYTVLILLLLNRNFETLTDSLKTKKEGRRTLMRSTGYKVRVHAHTTDDFFTGNEISNEDFEIEMLYCASNAKW